jgi:hypothetical protein
MWVEPPALAPSGSEMPTDQEVVCMSLDPDHCARRIGQRQLPRGDLHSDWSPRWPGQPVRQGRCDARWLAAWPGSWPELQATRVLYVPCWTDAVPGFVQVRISWLTNRSLVMRRSGVRFPEAAPENTLLP